MSKDKASRFGFITDIGYGISDWFDRDITKKGYLKFLLLGLVVFVLWLVWKM